jgi:carbonic anhydrase
VLWIGCSDSRVPETTLCDAAPGDVFVHRNIANVVRGGGGGGSGDGSVAAVVEFAVVHLGVRHVVVCGHTRCGGAKAGLGDADLGPALNAWLEPLRQLRREREQELAALEGEDAKADRLAEWNVLRSLANVRAMGAVADKVAAGELELHGLIYDVPSAELRVVSGRSAPEEHL